MRNNVSDTQAIVLIVGLGRHAQGKLHDSGRSPGSIPASMQNAANENEQRLAG
jgi:hypothetical protein